MNYISTTIAFENSHIKDVEDVLESLGLVNHFTEVAKIFGVFIEVHDYTETFKDSYRLLKKMNLKDDDPFFNEFEMSDYGVQLSFDVSRQFKHLDILEGIVLLLGQQISLLTPTSILVLFNRIPGGLFKKGALIQTFEKFNAEYVKDKYWRPLIAGD